MVEIDVVLSDEVPSEGFTGLCEVMQIGAVVATTGGTRALGIQRFEGELVDASAHLEETSRGEGASALSDLGRDDAIEHVHATAHGFEDIDWHADAHEVAGSVLWQEARGECADLLSGFAFFADGEATDRESVEWHPDQGRGAFCS